MARIEVKRVKVELELMRVASVAEAVEWMMRSKHTCYFLSCVNSIFIKLKS